MLLSSGESLIICGTIHYVRLINLNQIKLEYFTLTVGGMRNNIFGEIASLSLEIGKVTIVDLVFFSFVQGQTYSVEDEMCVPKSQCGCYFREEYYKPGDSRQHRCNTCTCENGHWSCTKHNCSGNFTSQSEFFNNCSNTSFLELK